jgi:hypothetical protein
LNPHGVNNESGQSSSLDSCPRESKQPAKIDSMRQQKAEKYLGGLSSECCCFKSPASNREGSYRPNLRQLSPGRTVRSTNSKLEDQIIVELSDTQAKSRDVPSWEKDKAALEGWTVKEQRGLINAISQSPRELQKQPAHKPLDGRNLTDCEECYAHIQANRIAYFGPMQHKSTIHQGGSPGVRTNQ